MNAPVRLTLVGIGTGSPAHLTLEAVSALRDADLVLVPRKGEANDDLAGLRRTICAAHRDPGRRTVEFDMPVRDRDAGYLAGVESWHDAIADAWRAVIVEHLPAGGTAALLIWGDPSLYDSSLRVARRTLRGLATRGGTDPAADCAADPGTDPGATDAARLRVIPAPGSLQVLAAEHAITLHGVGEPFLVTTGRRLRDGGWPDGIPSVAVMLDGECSFLRLAPAGIDIWWGAYLGMRGRQLLLAGPLAEVAPRIVAARAAARERHGWIMDTYLLRRRARTA